MQYGRVKIQYKLRICCVMFDCWWMDVVPKELVNEVKWCYQKKNNEFIMLLDSILISNLKFPD